LKDILDALECYKEISSAKTVYLFDEDAEKYEVPSRWRSDLDLDKEMVLDEVFHYILPVQSHEI
jgi:hypothetical protein